MLNTTQQALNWKWTRPTDKGGESPLGINGLIVWMLLYMGLLQSNKTSFMLCQTFKILVWTHQSQWRRLSHPKCVYLNSENRLYFIFHVI